MFSIQQKIFSYKGTWKHKARALASNIKSRRITKTCIRSQIARAVDDSHLCRLLVFSYLDIFSRDTKKEEKIERSHCKLYQLVIEK